MFLKTGELKKIMKAGLKQGGLTVANANERYLVHSGCWGACVEHPYASNKFKAAIMELIGTCRSLASATATPSERTKGSSKNRFMIIRTLMRSGKLPRIMPSLRPC